MPVITQDHITADTPLGANLIGGGATFRAWAPKATAVYLKLNTPAAAFQLGPATLLGQDAATGLWSGFVPGVKDGDTYRCYVTGQTGALARLAGGWYTAVLVPPCAGATHGHTPRSVVRRRTGRPCRRPPDP
jgi:1,4-alpha-glucan branching enzyme